MRIRKNAKLSPLLFSSSSSSSSSWCPRGGPVPVVETHVCQLNQSPWDVTPFDFDSIQFQPSTNGTKPDSSRPLQSAAAMDAAKSDQATTTLTVSNSKVVPLYFNTTTVTIANPCQELDNKGWPCKEEANQGQSLCSQHLALSLSVPYNNNKKAQAQGQAQAQAQAQAQGQGQSGTRRAKARGAGKKSAGSSNPYEFYYYSGFGPLWGKRRGDRNGEGSRSDLNSAMAESEDVVVVVDDINDDNVGGGEMQREGTIDYVDDDEEEVDDSGKKRMRKPVKARSLKSLM